MLTLDDQHGWIDVGAFDAIVPCRQHPIAHHERERDPHRDHRPGHCRTCGQQEHGPKQQWRSHRLHGDLLGPLAGLVYKYWTKGHLSGAIAP
jgi:hypothetical protein